ncbi:Nn.00g063500.m01.CDS01 [Neocucurbitaria sp. VM-36]
MRDLRPAIIGVNSALMSLSLAAISCRIGRRIFLVRSFGWHDALIAFAAFCATVFSILQMVSTHLGLGLPNSDVPAWNMVPVLKLVMASRFFYFICNWSVKHSLLLFYTELTIDRWPRRSIYFMHGIAFAFGCTCIGATLFQCTPIKAIWDVRIKGDCIDMNSFNYFNSCFMLATDLVLYAMPLVFTCRLQLKRTQRIGVSCLFALGGLVLAASIARVYSVHTQAENPDFTYKFAAIIICGVIENHLAILVACAPSIKVIMLLAFPGLAPKFEKLVSRDTQGCKGNESSKITVNLEAAFPVKVPDHWFLKPVSTRAFTDESKGSRENRMGNWWRAPSSWNVNAAGQIPPG